MTLADIKRQTLILLNEYSLDGALLADADYLLRIPDLATLAQNEVAARQPVVALYALTGTPVAYGQYYAYPLPADCVGLERVEAISDGLLELHPHGWLYRHPNIAVLDTSKTWNVYYRKQPAALVSDTDALEVSQEGQDAIPYFCAANLLMDENASVATLLLNQYYDRLKNLSQRPMRVRNGMGW